MKKLLYILPACGLGGPIRQITYILKSLDVSAFVPYIITVYKEDELASRLEEIKKYGEHFYIPTGKVQMMIGKNIELKRLIDKINPDVIHTVGVFPDFFTSRFYGNIQIRTIRNDLHDFIRRYGVLRGYIMLKMCIFSYKKSYCTFACSNALSQLCLRDFHMELPVIRNGVDVKKFGTVTQTERYRIRERLGLPAHSIIFVMSGRIYHIKNQAFLLEGFSKAFGKDDKVYLILLGEGPLRKELEEKYREFKNIRFEGLVQNVNEYLSVSDIYVSSSKTEGMPNGVLEGMASGLAVLLSDIPQHQEIYELNHNIGSLYQNGNLNHFIDTIRQMVCTDLTHMKEQSIYTAVTYVSAEQMSKEYQKAYMELCSYKNQ